jgi:hypothetical protein
MRARVITFLTVAAALAAVLLTGLAGPAQAAGDPGGSSCGAGGYQWSYYVACQSGTSAPGAPGTRTASAGGSGPVALPCAYYPVAGNAHAGGLPA